MEPTQNALNWFEIPVSDFERARSFYNRIFDYEMQEVTMGPYHMGVLSYGQGKGVGGAIIKGEGHVPSTSGVLVYLNGGNDLNTILERVESAGGKILQPKTQVTPEIGYSALFVDTEGNRVGLHSPH